MVISQFEVYIPKVYSEVYKYTYVCICILPKVYSKNDEAMCKPWAIRGTALAEHRQKLGTSVIVYCITEGKHNYTYLSLIDESKVKTHGHCLIGHVT